jgi:hypothetical protein
VYEKKCGKQKMYGYLYLWNYKTLKEAKKENKEEIKEWERKFKEMKCEE